MENYQLRVVIEKAELDIKRNDLAAILAKAEIPGVELMEHGELLRLKHQAEVMAQYSKVLGDRIANF